MASSILEFIAMISAALFAGTALYINVAEHPARMGLETRLAALQWAPSYKHSWPWSACSLAWQFGFLVVA
jgi:ABC-type transport system involved in cytochrome bd biosynthesis fused ATPase/permease subunit